MAGHLHVISGCSGSGKSTLIAALAARGERVSSEPGRQIVKDELARGGDGLPWSNTQRFIDLCAASALAAHTEHAAQPDRVFFDRSFIDVASAVESSGLSMPGALSAALNTYRYADLVFISAPWKALFCSDAERRHSFGDALAEYERLVPAYRHHGYEVVMIPQASVAERVEFVLATLAQREGAR